MSTRDEMRRIELRHATWSLDLAVTGIIAVLVLLPTLLFGLRSNTDPMLLPTSLVMVVAVALRRRRPLMVLLVVATCFLVQAWLVQYPTFSLVLVPVTVYSVARWVPGLPARLALVIGLFGSIVGPVSWLRAFTGASFEDLLHSLGPNSSSGTILAVLALGVVMCAAIVLSSYATGRRVRESAQAGQERLVAEAKRRQLELSEREQAAQSAEAAVRAQIARELHDVVAHSLSVMVVQAEGGRAIAAKRPDQAVVALDTIAETGRDALTQMRRIVGVLRGTPDENADFAPSPGLEQIPELVERAGDGRVHLVVTGSMPQVPPTFALVVYRVVQEAITNFLKHAGPEAHAQVQLSYGSEVIIVEVLDDGAGVLAGNDGRGHGLRGMRERVGSQGGQLVARPRQGGGFLVRAVLPVPSDRSPSRGPRSPDLSRGPCGQPNQSPPNPFTDDTRMMER